jgi:hypothetical protein
MVNLKSVQRKQLPSLWLWILPLLAFALPLTVGKLLHLETVSTANTSSEAPSAEPEPAVPTELAETSSNKSISSIPADESSAPAPPGAMKMNRNGFGCTDRDYFDRLIKMGAQGDEKAMENGISLGLMSGQCAFLKKGAVVYLDDQGFLIKVRPAGSQTGYWTVREAAE